MSSFLDRAARTYFSGEFARYALCGVASSLAHIVARLAASEYMSFGLAIVVSYGFGTVVAFLLYKTLVFTESGPATRRQFVIFCMIYVAWFPVTWLLSVGFQRIFGLITDRAYSELAAHVCAIILPVLINFLINKFFVFQKES